MQKKLANIRKASGTMKVDLLTDLVAELVERLEKKDNMETQAKAPVVPATATKSAKGK